MFRKYVLAFLALAFFFSTVSVSAYFPDVKSFDPYYIDIGRLQKVQFVKGDENGFFNPDKGITRCEMAKLTWRIYTAFLPKDTVVIDDGFPTSVFPDIPEGHWCDFEASRLKAFGIVKGNEKGNFEPNREVSAVEAFKMILNAVQVDFSAYEIDEQAPWYLNYVGYIFSNALEEYISLQNVPVNQAIARKSVARVIKRLLDIKENQVYTIYQSAFLGSVKIAYQTGEYDVDYGPGMEGYDDDYVLFKALHPVISHSSIWGNDYKFRFVDKETLDYYMKIGSYSYHKYNRDHDEDDELECRELGKKNINGHEFTKYSCPGPENPYGYYAAIGNNYFWGETSNPIRGETNPFVEGFEDIMSSVHW